MKIMYLSRVPLDVSKRKTQAALASPNKIHGAVEEAFAEKQCRNLWRIDKLRGNFYLLIVSAEKPNLSWISAQFGFEDDCGESKEYEGLLGRIENGSAWHFRLAANPVHSLKEGKERGKVTAHTSEKYQLKWLEAQSEKKGFCLLPGSVRVVESHWRIFMKRECGQRVRILEAVFEGNLCVQDVELFRETLVNGIGRGRAYGMGLLTIVRTGGNNGT